MYVNHGVRQRKRPPGAIYGGYSGAGMGVMVLAALGVVLDDSLARINALEQTVSLAVNVSAALVFLIWGPIDWALTLVMAGAALAGGALGGMLATRIPPAVLRSTIVLLEVGVLAVYFAKP